MGNLTIKRIYEDASSEDGARILVDRLWPRGMKKERAALDEWAKAAAPSPDLRKWYSHDPAKFQEFRVRYLEELDDSDDAASFRASVYKRLEEGNVTLLYAAKDPSNNHAVILKEWLER